MMMRFAIIGLYGLFWLLTYILIIRRGFLDRTYGMPVAALAFNLCWEFFFSFVVPSAPPQVFANYIWLAADIIILVQTLWLGRKVFRDNWPDFVPDSFFYLGVALSLAISYAILHLAVFEIPGWSELLYAPRTGAPFIWGALYTAFGSNVIMSGLFIFMLLLRRDVAGQSCYIALFKLLGTFFAGVYQHLYLAPSHLITVFSGAVLVLDAFYLWLLWRWSKVLEIDPWQRW
ncbi:MAG: hypothetical protein JW981_09020 [Anaerolineae bacterium]|nr:hypothetical protein [Anaerolineae bacterium]